MTIKPGTQPPIKPGTEAEQRLVSAVKGSTNDRLRGGVVSVFVGYRRRAIEWQRRAEEAMALSERLRAENERLRARLDEAQLREEAR